MTRTLLLTFIFAAGAFAQTGTIITSTRYQAFTSTGTQCSGCKVYTYTTGTTTPLATYTDSTQATPNTNPVILDTRGEASIWLGAGLSYRFVLKTAADVTIRTDDGVQNIGNNSLSGWQVSNTTVIDSTRKGLFTNVDIQSGGKLQVYNTGNSAVMATITGVAPLFNQSNFGQVYTGIVGSIDPVTMFRNIHGGDYGAEVFTGAILIPSTATVAGTGQSSAQPLAGYIKNQSTNWIAVGVYTLCVVEVVSGSCYGGNFVSRTTVGLAGGAELQGFEMDVNPDNAADTGFGFQAALNKITVGVPIGTFQGSAYIATASNSADSHWNAGLDTYPNAVDYVIKAEPTCLDGAGPCNSPWLTLYGRAAGTPGAYQEYSMRATAAGNIETSTTSSTANLQLNSTGLGLFVSPSYTLQVQKAVGGDILAWIRNTSGSAASQALKLTAGTDASNALAISNAANTVTTATITSAGAGYFLTTVRADGGYLIGGSTGITSVLSVRDSGGAGDCTITINGGIATASTC